MFIIRPTCRNRFTPSDFDFLLNVLSRESDTTRQSLETLFEDPGSLDSLLDQEALFHALLEERALLGVSTYFYFYILVRHVLLETGCEDRELADYVAALLSEFSSTRRMRGALGESRPMDYMVDMLQAMREVDEPTRFALMLHLGNYALFLSGLYADYIERRSVRRAAPSLEYYESIGRSQFQAASDHRLAAKYQLGPLLGTLASEFRSTRMAINDISDRLFIWSEVHLP
jgi:hypothetical protein